MQAGKESRDPNVVRVSPEMMSGIKVAPVAKAEIGDTFRIASQIMLDQDRVARIGARVTGRISEIRVTLGQRVERGQLLAAIDSTELATAQLAYLKAANQVQLQTRAVERARLLLSADVIGSAELQRRENELASAEAELRAAEDQLKVLGMSTEAIENLAQIRTINSVSPITSTLSGTVIERKVTQGQVVQPADVLFTIADLSYIWAIAEVPEQQVHLIQLGQKVEVEVPALPHRDGLIGKITYIADMVNPETRTVTVRTGLPNPDQSLKPAMLAQHGDPGAAGDPPRRSGPGRRTRRERRPRAGPDGRRRIPASARQTGSGRERPAAGPGGAEGGREDRHRGSLPSQ